VDPVPDPLLHRKSGSVGNRTRTSQSVARNYVKITGMNHLKNGTVSHRSNAFEACVSETEP
jgi:hypothetical protein